MSKTVNILGDTPKQQWLNAINLMELSITGNLVPARNTIESDFGYDPDEWDGVSECIDYAIEHTKIFADEMRRLVEGAFDD